jgi:hypothetical protein
LHSRSGTGFKMLRGFKPYHTCGVISVVWLLMLR